MMQSVRMPGDRLLSKQQRRPLLRYEDTIKDVFTCTIVELTWKKERNDMKEGREHNYESCRTFAFNIYFLLCGTVPADGRVNGV